MPSPDLTPLTERCRHHPVLGPLATRLSAAGTPLYVVGGPVRDTMLGRPPSDLDVATAADASSIAAAAEGLGTVNLVGAAFGVVKVAAAGEELDVATFRADSYETGSRRPAIRPVGDLVSDLSRRDFTINAMAVPLDGDATLVDPFCGASHLDSRLLTTPQDPSVSFRDDPLRIHRAWRFAATLQLDLSPALPAAAAAARDELTSVSRERKLAELDKVLSREDPGVFPAAVQLMGHLQVTGDVLPGATTVLLPPALPARGSRLVWLARQLGEQLPDQLGMCVADRKLVAAGLRTIALLGGADILSARQVVRTQPDEVLAAAMPLLEPDDAATLASVHADADRWRQPLPVDGRDLVAAAGRSPGPWVGELLRTAELRWLEQAPATTQATARFREELLADVRQQTAA